MKRGDFIDAPADGCGVVHAEFTDGGKLYHYYCPTGRPGDRIKAPANSAATIVGLGWASPTARTNALRVASVITTAGGRKKMNEYAGIKTYTAEHHEAEAKRLRKAEKAARKAEKAARQRARAVAEHRAEQARLHKLALDALAEIVADGRKPTAHRVAAARELLAVTA